MKDNLLWIHSIIDTQLLSLKYLTSKVNVSPICIIKNTIETFLRKALNCRIFWQVVIFIAYKKIIITLIGPKTDSESINVRTIDSITVWNNHNKFISYRIQPKCCWVRIPPIFDWDFVEKSVSSRKTKNSLSIFIRIQEKS